MPRSHKPKTVRIIPPQSSTSDKDPAYRNLSAVPSASSDRSPSPGSESDEHSDRDLEHASLIDPFDNESDEGGTTSEDEENLRRNTSGNTGYKKITVDIMPPNPFRKTLASQEPISSVLRNEGSDPDPARPLYDVDDFKRLLLTGERIATHANALSTVLAPDSSSSTDASSISRQSIFEPLPGNNQDTPRTSHEVSPSEDDRKEPGDRISVGPRKAKPSTPEHRHGKLVAGNVAPAVSPKDPKLSIPASTYKHAALGVHSIPISPWTPTDLNKPLPPPPVSPGLEAPDQQLTATTEVAADNQRDTSSSSALQAPISRSSSIRSRPAPPPSRRQSLLRSNSLARGSEHRNSISEENLEALYPPSSAVSTSGSKPPPTPPRRHGRARGLSASSTSSAISANAAALPKIFSTNDKAPASSMSRPPPLPPTRTSSVSSYKRPTRPATNPNSPLMAPPPAPPRRRRGSSQSSIIRPQPGEEYLSAPSPEGEVSTGGGDLLTHPPLANTAMEFGFGEGKDVMADLSALQRDVDELRRKFKD